MKFNAFSFISLALLNLSYAHVIPLVYQPSAAVVRSPAYYSTYNEIPYPSVASFLPQAYQPIQFHYFDTAPLTYPNYYVHNFVEHPLVFPQPQAPIEIPLGSNKPTSTAAPEYENADKDSNKDKDDNIPTNDFESTNDSKKDEDDTVAVESAK